MKKRILGAALLVAIAVAAGWNYNQSRNEVPLSDLALANAEALAQGETDWGNRFCPHVTKGNNNNMMINFMVYLF